MPLLIGVAVTRAEVEWTFMHRFRIEDGRIAEHWACRDDVGLLHQLGPGRRPERRSSDTYWASWWRLLGSRPGSLVLDNCEHVRDDAAAVASDLLRHCPALRIPATSRVGFALPRSVHLRNGGDHRERDHDGLAVR
jgi:hypothetical protein